jgi:hypothetical protein
MPRKSIPVETHTGPVDWERLPDALTVPELCPILRCGIRSAYRWADEHPGLVIRLSGVGKRVSRDALRRFLACDPEIVAIATRDPYAKPVRASLEK